MTVVTTVSEGRYRSRTTWRSGMFSRLVSGTPRHPVNIKIALHMGRLSCGSRFCFSLSPRSSAARQSASPSLPWRTPIPIARPHERRAPHPLYRGQPGYSSKLDRDGDGVACETGSSGYSPGQSIPAPAIPSASVPQPVPAPLLPSGGSEVYETVVNWTGTDCIDITAPDSSPAGVLATSNHCGGIARFSHEANSSQLVGADPIMGAAESITCEILVGRLRDSGTRGDGHDVNCLTRADTLRASA